MPKVMEIEGFLEAVAPIGLKMSFDNVGFLVGDESAEVDRVLVALDITEEVIGEAEELGAQLIVSHHPIIFTPLKRVTNQDTAGRKTMRLIQSNIAAICMHTNLDAVSGGVNDVLGERLGLREMQILHTDGMDGNGKPFGIGRVGRLEGATSFEAYAKQVKQALGCNGIRYCSVGAPVFHVAVGGGACGDLLEAVIALGCDTFITADVKYDVFLEAGARGINLIDAGHYPTEDVICDSLVHRLQGSFPDIMVSKSEVHCEAVRYM